MTARGRRLRVGITVALLAVTMAGTIRGTDDDFPFGPMKMYAYAHGLDTPVHDTWAWATDTHGHVFRLSQYKTGVRRAEIEGQLPAFKKDPSRLAYLADTLHKRFPDRRRVVKIQIRTLLIAMHDGKPTGHKHYWVRVTWYAPGTHHPHTHKHAA